MTLGLMFAGMSLPCQFVENKCSLPKIILAAIFAATYIGIAIGHIPGL